MKRSAAALVSLFLALAVVLFGPPASASTPSCGIRWGSLPKESPVMSTGEVFDVRAGRHTCYDRLVLDVDGDAPGYVVGYVGQVTQDGSGDVVAVRGGAELQVIARSPIRPTDDIFLPDGRLVDTTGYRTFRDVVYAGSFEGQTTFGLGVRARLPFRVVVLDGPGSGSRLVVDFAHQW